MDSKVKVPLYSRKFPL
uniref:Uncharacterized protein n=1 Tax=Rhizophora mucronata TaxID=61149 RepID=A0A2P2NJY8_RHIMU